MCNLFPLEYSLFSFSTDTVATVEADSCFSADWPRAHKLLLRSRWPGGERHVLTSCVTLVIPEAHWDSCYTACTACLVSPRGARVSCAVVLSGTDTIEENTVFDSHEAPLFHLWVRPALLLEFCSVVCSCWDTRAEGHYSPVPQVKARHHVSLPQCALMPQWCLVMLDFTAFISANKSSPESIRPRCAETFLEMFLDRRCVCPAVCYCPQQTL